MFLFCVLIAVFEIVFVMLFTYVCFFYCWFVCGLFGVGYLIVGNDVGLLWMSLVVI